MEIMRLDRESFEQWKEGIAVLIKESVSASFPHKHIGMEYCTEKCHEIQIYLQENKAVVFLAIDKNGLTGFIWCHQIQRLDEMRLHVAHLSVLPDWRKHGVGRMLTEAAVRYACEQNLKAVEMFASTSNSQAVNFYENAGFEIERYLFAKEIN